VAANRFPGVLALGAKDLAVDLGTANTLVYSKGHGIVLDEPSVVAINANTGQLLAVGLEAKRMTGRTPATIEVIRPLKDGVIADFDICEKMLAYFIHRVTPGRWAAKPRIVAVNPRIGRANDEPKARPARRMTTAATATATSMTRMVLFHAANISPTSTRAKADQPMPGKSPTPLLCA